jgi:predicted phage terminase large subunit-like protein
VPDVTAAIDTRDIAPLRAVLRHDLSSFIQKAFHTVAGGIPYQHNWHIDALAHHLTGVLEGRIKRLIITMPPRHLKSIAASVAFPAWALGHDPALRILCISYAQELSLKHALDCRAVMESAWYQQIFPLTRIHPDRNTQLEVMTTKRGFRLATSVGGTLTGRGGNIIILDDPHKPEEVLSDTRREAVKNWVGSTLYSRLDDKAEDAMILIQQRLHDDDLAGTFLAQGGWTHLNLPAIAEERQEIAIGVGGTHVRQPGDVLHGARESAETIEAIKRSMGSYNFAAQYQQRPAPLGGGIIEWKWFRFYETAPRKQAGDQVVISWDTASKAEEINDYSVATTWLVRGKQYHLLNVTRRRLEYPALRRLAIELACTSFADVLLIEDKGSGTQLIQDLRLERAIGTVIARLPEADKITRMSVQTPAIEAGQVLLPKAAPWLADFHNEVVTFPKGRHDDQVDSLSQFLTWAQRRHLNEPRIRILGRPEWPFRPGW